jgi:formamidopyrimidine-DNA glycosylase
MPELPEVEAARRGLAEQFVGRAVLAYDLTLPRLIVAQAGLSLDALVGATLARVARHGKYLTLDFGAVCGVMHLKLSGQLAGRGGAIAGFTAGHPVPAYGSPLPHKSTHLTLEFEHDARLYLTDMRHWARLRLLPSDALPAFMDALRLGPDAASAAFTAKWLHDALRKRRSGRIKPVLLDQSFVAGLGNIYVDESLHRARLHPERVAQSLSAAESERLQRAIAETLAIAIPLGGASVINGKATAEHGAFPFAHGRNGLPCLVCGTPIVKSRVDERATYTCPSCQPAP